MALSFIINSILILLYLDILFRITYKIKNIFFIKLNIGASYFLNFLDLLSTFLLFKFSTNTVETNNFFIYTLSTGNAIQNYMVLFLFKATITTISVICIQQGFSAHVEKTIITGYFSLSTLPAKTVVSIKEEFKLFLNLLSGKSGEIDVAEDYFPEVLSTYHYIFYRPMIILIIISIYIPINNFILLFLGSYYKLYYLYIILLAMLIILIISPFILYLTISNGSKNQGS